MELYEADAAENDFCVSQGSTGEVSEFTILLCEMSSGFGNPKIIKVGLFLLNYSNIKRKNVF